MQKPNALEFFRGESGYNCAQAIVKAYGPLVGAGDGSLERFARFGAGRAPGGECGALFAAKAILEDDAAKQEIQQEFASVAGSTTCRDIRKGRQASCEQCVQIAADALFSHLNRHGLLRRPTC